MSTSVFLKDSYLQDIISSSNVNNVNNVSNVNNIENLIEEKIENKINELLKSLPDDYKREDKMIYNLTVNEIYQNTIQTIIDIINDITSLIADKDFITNQMYKERLLNIFLDNKRRIYIGIILVLFSFILYFIDGASV